MYAGAPTMGIADGVDEVHKATVARRVLKSYTPHDGYWPTEYYPAKRAAAREKFEPPVPGGSRPAGAGRRLRPLHRQPDLMADLAGARVAVTGVTGRVAKPIAVQLAAGGADVVGLARFSNTAVRDELTAAGVECVAVDLGGDDLASVPTDIDVLVNMAVTWSADWDEALSVNAEGLGLLVDHLPELRALVHCSTVGVYAVQDGLRTEQSPLGDSNTAVMPTYSISKIAAEALARYVARSRQLPTTIARLNVAYGNHGGLPYFHLLSILQGDPVPLHESEPNEFNLVHEDDLAASIPLLVDAAGVPATVLNWCNPEITTAEAWCEELARLVGRDVSFARSTAVSPPCPVDASALVAAGFEVGVDWRDGLPAHGRPPPSGRAGRLSGDPRRCLRGPTTIRGSNEERNKESPWRPRSQPSSTRWVGTSGTCT